MLEWVTFAYSDNRRSTTMQTKCDIIHRLVAKRLPDTSCADGYLCAVVVDVPVVNLIIARNDA